MKMKRALSGVAASLAATAALLAPIASSPITPVAVAADDKPYDIDTDGDTIPQYLELTDWYTNKNPWPNSSTPEEEWTHNAYPITCNNNAADRAWKVVWVVQQSNLANALTTTNIGQVRNVLGAVTSAFPASAGITVATKAGLTTNHAPRWVTFQRADGTCEPSIATIGVPSTVLDKSVYEGESGALDDYLAANGFDDPKRKYLVFVQKSEWDEQQGFGGLYTGWATGADGTVTGPTNNANHGGAGEYAIVATDATFFKGNSIHTAVHEMTHAIGGMQPNQPHRNPQNGAHPTDCFDVLCYDPGGGPIGGNGQQYLAACGRDTSKGLLSDFDESRQTFRLDCNDDDYFAAPSQIAAGSWLTNHWNGYNSAFLWGGVQPSTTLAKPGYSPSFIE